MRLKWARRALSDLDALQVYIAQDKPEAARRQAALILTAVDGLVRFPHSGRPGRLEGTRELVVAGTTFIVPYRVRADTVEILGVFHGRQQWPKAF